MADTNPMSQMHTLSNQFLIAMPNLGDPNFARTVTFMCEHNDEGAMGVVVNRPLDINLGEVLDQLGIEPANAQIAGQHVYQGGPVQNERGFVLHRPLGNWEATLAISDEVGLSASHDILEAIARGEGPDDYLVILGYAGWNAGQLDEEMGQNTWISGPAQTDILFRTPDEQKWIAAARHLGIDLSLMSSESGHA